MSVGSKRLGVLLVPDDPVLGGTLEQALGAGSAVAGCDVEAVPSMLGQLGVDVLVIPFPWPASLVPAALIAGIPLATRPAIVAAPTGAAASPDQVARLTSALEARTIAGLGPVAGEPSAWAACLQRAAASRSALTGPTAPLAPIAQAIPDGLVVLDGDRRLIVANQVATRMLALGDDLTSAPRLVSERLGFDPVSRIANEPGAIREEVRLAGRVLDVVVAPLAGTAPQPGAVIVLHDVTQRRELERRQAEMLAVVSHEVRTPLTSITGAIDLMLSHSPDPLTAKQRQYLNMARDSSDQLRSIVDELLDAASLEHGRLPLRFAKTSLDKIVRAAVDRFAAAAELREVHLKLAAPTPELEVVGDGQRIAQVVNNLLGNALKFAPPGGRVEVVVFGQASPQGIVGVSIYNDGETIPEVDRERVFDKFEQLAVAPLRRAGGTGLGLTIARSIIEGHGGRIWVEGVPGGTKFVFTLPASAELDDGLSAAPFPLDVPSPRAVRTPSGRTVLVVDDDRYSAYLMKGVLMGAGHRVLTAHTGDAALSIARDRAPDLIVLDVLLPDLDGMALVETLRHDPETRHAPVIVVSLEARRAQALGAGADAALLKPLDVEQFRETCARLLDEQARAHAPRILIAAGTVPRLRALREPLERAEMLVREVSTGADALVEARRFKPQAVLIDLALPDLDGFQVAHRLRADPDAAMTPLFLVAEVKDSAAQVRALELGAEDYLVEPIDPDELIARVQRALRRHDQEIGVSPTTRLPGADQIEAEVERRLAGGGLWAFCYLDLDNLKAYNDYYGYAKADAVIRQTAAIAREAVLREGGPSAFVGHIAGDDFVFVTPAERADATCLSICRAFDAVVPLYYAARDRDRGFIETVDRYGELRRFPIMTISIGALTMSATRFERFSEVAREAAEAKQLAKALVGSSIVRDGIPILPAPPPVVTHPAGPPVAQR